MCFSEDAWSLVWLACALAASASVMCLSRVCRCMPSAIEIGSGTFGTVFRGPLQNGVPTVQKRFKMDDDMDTFVAVSEVSFYKATPRHRNIVDFVDFFFDPRGKPVLCLRCMEETLDAAALRAKEHYSMDSSLALSDMFNQVCDGLAHIHAHGFMHRDLKPANVVVDGALNSKLRRVSICDFGLCAPYVPGRTNSICVQSLWWRAPEVIQGNAFYGPQSDMWSLGVILIELALGRDFVCSGCNIFDQEVLVKRIHSRVDGTCRPGGVWYELASFDEDCYRVASRLLTTDERRVRHWTPSEPMNEGLCEEKLTHAVQDPSPPSSPVFYDALVVAEEHPVVEDVGSKRQRVGDTHAEAKSFICKSTDDADVGRHASALASRALTRIALKGGRGSLSVRDLSVACLDLSRRLFRGNPNRSFENDAHLSQLYELLDFDVF